MEDRSKPIVVSQTFDVPRSTLWKAITEQDQLVKWFFKEIPEFEAVVGFSTRFNVDAGERQFMHLWKILEVEEEKRIVYDWSYEEYPGKGKVIFEISGEDKNSELVLTNEGLDSFPAEIPEFSKEACVGGWEYFIKGRLREYLRK